MGWTAPTIPTGLQRVAPTTGQSVVCDGSRYLAIVPAGTIAALTVTFPASPADGQHLGVFTTQAITSLTVNGGTLRNPLTSAPANAFAEWRYLAFDGFWLRVG